MNRSVVMAVVNQKGGVGKTTTCENLGIGLANEGKRVLLIDSDPQGSLTISLGYPRPDEIDVTISEIYAKVIQDFSVFWDFAIFKPMFEHSRTQTGSRSQSPGGLFGRC